MSLTSAQSVVKSPQQCTDQPLRSPYLAHDSKQPINFIKKPAQGLLRKEEEGNSVEVRGDYSTSC